MPENEQVNQSSDRNHRKTGNSFDVTTEYLTRLILRDHPLIAEKLVNGQFDSLESAAREAGIIELTDVKNQALEEMLNVWRQSSMATRRLFLNLADEEIKVAGTTIPFKLGKDRTAEDTQDESVDRTDIGLDHETAEAHVTKGAIETETVTEEEQLENTTVLSDGTAIHDIATELEDSLKTVNTVFTDQSRETDQSAKDRKADVIPESEENRVDDLVKNDEQETFIPESESPVTETAPGIAEIETEENGSTQYESVLPHAGLDRLEEQIESEVAAIEQMTADAEEAQASTEEEAPESAESAVETAEDITATVDEDSIEGVREDSSESSSEFQPVAETIAEEPAVEKPVEEPVSQEMAVEDEPGEATLSETGVNTDEIVREATEEAVEDTETEVVDSGVETAAVQTDVSEPPPVIPEPKKVPPKPEAPRRWVELEQQLHEVTKLPALPAVFLKVMSLASNPHTDIESLYRVLMTDPALSSTLLRLANSAYYGLGNEVRTLRMALVVLGTKEVCRLVSTVAVVNAFPQQKSKVSAEETFDYDAFWLHSSSVAATSEIISNRFKVDVPEEVHMAGLLHDIGKVFLASYFLKDIVKCQRFAREYDLPLWKAEQHLYSTDHARVGAYLAQIWELPVILVNTIRFHHEFSHAKSNRAEAAVVHISNNICNMYEKTAAKNKETEGSEDTEVDYNILAEDPAWMQVTGGREIPPAVMDKLIHDIEGVIKESEDFIHHAQS